MKKRTYTGKPLGDTEYLLEQWGWWRMDGMGVPRYVSQLHALIRENTPCESSFKEYVITDELAMAVDGAVSRLTKRDQQMGDILWLYFGAKWTAVRVAREYKIGEPKFREIMKAGVAWVDCALENLREAA